MLNRKELAIEIFRVSHLTGKFKLRSGQVSSEYFDKYRFEALPDLLREIASQMAKLIPPQTEVLAGLEMGGIPVATALGLVTGLPVAFVRKAAKQYGTCLFAEGFEVANKRVCIIEDVVTTGGQVLTSTQDLRQIGAEIMDVLCVIHRGEDLTAFKQAGLTLHPLFTMAELKQFAG
jgi:orotate phosphoribosyltransferase